jgi:hypothetical protein
MIMTGETTETYTGDGTSGLFVWQAQLETGSVATSPIVTTAGTASRVADVVSLTGASSLIGATEGSLFIEFEIGALLGATARGFLTISNGTTSQRVNLAWVSTASNEMSMIVTSGTTQANIGTSAQVKVGIYKVSCAYKVNDFAFVVDGSVIGTDTSGLVPTGMDRIDLGQNLTANSLQGWIRSCAIFPTRLPNATLQSLTA